LPTGDVAILGGDNGNGVNELYHPSTNTCTASAPFIEGRYQHSAAVITTGVNAGKLIAEASGKTARVRYLILLLGKSVGTDAQKTARFLQKSLTTGTGIIIEIGGHGVTVADPTTGEVYQP
jgi:hypothetical protein